MELSEEDKNTIIKFYEGHLAQNGPNHAQTLNWTNNRQQLIRFNTLQRIGNLEGKTVLDVGCGLADLYGFLEANKIHTNYYGIDIVPAFIDEARKKYPGVDVAIDDIFQITKPYDYIFASGSLSYTVKDNDAFYESMIRKMYDLATIGVGFNMLDDDYYNRDAVYAVYNAEMILDFCRTFAARAYLIRGYSEGDFTVFLYKDPNATFISIHE
jgi:trans-aconitate methyltransferase